MVSRENLEFWFLAGWRSNPTVQAIFYSNTRLAQLCSVARDVTKRGRGIEGDFELAAPVQTGKGVSIGLGSSVTESI